MTQAEQVAAVETAESERAKIWAHSGDSHVMEPDDLWVERESEYT